MLHPAKQVALFSPLLTVLLVNCSSCSWLQCGQVCVILLNCWLTSLRCTDLHMLLSSLECWFSWQLSKLAHNLRTWGVVSSFAFATPLTGVSIVARGSPRGGPQCMQSGCHRQLSTWCKSIRILLASPSWSYKTRYLMNSTAKNPNSYLLLLIKLGSKLNSALTSAYVG